MGLGQFVPQILKWVTGSDKAAEVAQKAIDIAQTVTGQPNGDAALKALQADPNLVLQYRKAVLDEEVTFQQLAVQNATEINATMRTEAAADHWPTYSWRPAIGFSIAINVLMTSLVVMIAYTGVMFFAVKAEVLSYVPAMIGSMAALLAAPSGIVGVASWFRGKAQADPRIPTDNRG